MLKFPGQLATMQDLTLVQLSEEEVKNLNQSEGRKLDEDGYYIKVFVVNDRQNKAADPWPFKIHAKSLRQIADTIIGRPYVVGPDPAKHVRGATSSDPADIIQAQKRWAVGEFVATLVNELSRNVYGIVKVFPEFIKELKDGRVRGASVPPYSSCLVEPRQYDENGEIIDGRILHVQAVNRPGYGEVAKVVGTCDGMLGECMQELRALGAAGQLMQYQASLHNSYSNSAGTEDREPSMDENKIAELVKTGITSALTEFEQKHSKVLGAAGAPAAPAQQAVQEKPEPADPVKAPQADASGDAGQEAQPDLKAEFESMKADFAKETKKREAAESLLRENERSHKIEKIVSLEMRLHKVSPAKKKERISKYQKAKDADGNPRDLDLLLESLEEEAAKTVGASGEVDDNYPGLHLGASGEEQPQDNFLDVFDSIRRTTT